MYINYTQFKSFLIIPTCCHCSLCC